MVGTLAKGGQASAAAVSRSTEGAATTLTKRVIRNAVAQPRPEEHRMLTQALATRPSGATLAGPFAAMAARAASKVSALRFLTRRTPMWMLATVVPALWSAVARDQRVERSRLVPDVARRVRRGRTRSGPAGDDGGPARPWASRLIQTPASATAHWCCGGWERGPGGSLRWETGDDPIRGAWRQHRPFPSRSSAVVRSRASGATRLEPSSRPRFTASRPPTYLPSEATRWSVSRSIETRTCSIESRSRTVTARSSSDSKSKVTHNGVPISS